VRSKTIVLFPFGIVIPSRATFRSWYEIGRLHTIVARVARYGRGSQPIGAKQGQVDRPEETLVSSAIYHPHQAYEDDGGLPRRVVGRIGAAFFALAGVVTLFTLLLPPARPHHVLGVALVALAAIAIGITNWFLPWDAWSRRAALWFVPVAFTLIALHNYFARDEPARFGLFFIVSFTWIGLACPRWTSLPFVPLMVVAYITPLVVTGTSFSTALSATVFTAPVCVLVAEAIAWVGERLRVAQRSLPESEVRFRSLVQNASDLVAVVGPDGTARYVSPAIQHVLGYRPEDVIGTSVFDRIHPDDLSHARAQLSELIHGGGTMPPTQFRYRRPDGSWIFVEATATNLLDNPAVRGIVINARDISERKRFEEELVYQAYHDALTGLPNRAFLQRRLADSLAQATRERTKVALLFIDLDNFKLINDSLGHEAGDQVLSEFGKRLLGGIRCGDVAARFGGDEFIVLMHGTSGTDAALAAADRLAAVLAEPYVVDGHELVITNSIGVALGGDPDDRPEDLIRNADAAMHRAKLLGKARRVVFDPAMYDQAVERLALERDLRRALEHGEFRLYYQPVLDVRTRQPVEVEALLRWHHPERGPVAPSEFIPIAEETGLIVPLGHWVLAEACRQLAAWRTEFPDCAPRVVSVNLSARQFRHPSLVADIAEILTDTGLPPQSLKLEITESVMMDDTASTLDTLCALKRLGIQLAVDDFGTGYSSLSYLKRLPTDAMKIDRSFARGLGQSREDQALVEAMIAAANALRLQVTVEGVETAEQLDFLERIGCDRVQGYLFAPPMPADAAAHFLQTAPRVSGSYHPVLP